MSDRRVWTVRLTARAEADFRDIVAWTLEQFGNRQAQIYADTLIAALEALSEGPATPGALDRPEIGRGVFTLHVARGNRRGRHFVLCRIVEGGRTQTLDVLRLLHDAMDLARHTPSSSET